MSEVQLDYAKIISDAEKRQEIENFAKGDKGLQAYIEYGILLQSLRVAMNALENIKCWKTFGIQNNPHEIVSHASAALKEIAAFSQVVTTAEKGDGG